MGFICFRQQVFFIALCKLVSGKPPALFFEKSETPEYFVESMILRECILGRKVNDKKGVR